MSGSDLKWGSVAVPAGVSVTRLRIKVQKDAKLCRDAGGNGIGASIQGTRADGSTISTNSDVELRFALDQPLVLTTGTTSLELSLDGFISALKSAVSGGSLKGNNLKSIIEAQQGRAHKKS